MMKHFAVMFALATVGCATPNRNHWVWNENVDSAVLDEYLRLKHFHHSSACATFFTVQNHPPEKALLVLQEALECTPCPQEAFDIVRVAAFDDMAQFRAAYAPLVKGWCEDAPSHAERLVFHNYVGGMIGDDILKVLKRFAEIPELTDVSGKVRQAVALIEQAREKRHGGEPQH